MDAAAAAAATQVTANNSRNKRFWHFISTGLNNAALLAQLQARMTDRIRLVSDGHTVSPPFLCPTMQRCTTPALHARIHSSFGS